jgi:hypothetical protein
MLKLLTDPEVMAVPACAPCAVEAEPSAVPAIHRPSRSWRTRQWLKLLLDGSFFIPTFARIARRLHLAVAYGELRGIVLHADGSVTDYGLLGRRVITDAGVAYLTADMAGGASDINLFKYHGFGTGSNAEAVGNTALHTELTTEYAVNSTRPTGSQSSSTNTYTTVGTLSPDANVAITEHGVFSATSAGTLWDKTLFSAINLVGSADSLQATYVSTFPAGS